MGLFSFAESPQLQALLADIAPPTVRDASFALYFTLAFGVGSLWTAVYGAIIDGAGRARRACRSCSWLMAVSFVLAALAASRSGSRRRIGRRRVPWRRLNRRGAARTAPLLSCRRPCDNGHLGRGVAQLGSAHRSGR